MRQFKCGKCGTEFSTREAVQEHMLLCDVDSDGPAVYECGKCGATFSTANACQEHKKTCTGK